MGDIKLSRPARNIPQEPPPINWFKLTDDIAERFRWYPTRDNLVSLLDAWN